MLQTVTETDMFLFVLNHHIVFLVLFWDCKGAFWGLYLTIHFQILPIRRIELILEQFANLHIFSLGLCWDVAGLKQQSCLFSTGTERVKNLLPNKFITNKIITNKFITNKFILSQPPQDWLEINGFFSWKKHLLISWTIHGMHPFHPFTIQPYSDCNQSSLVSPGRKGCSHESLQIPETQPAPPTDLETLPPISSFPLQKQPEKYTKYSKYSKAT